MRLPKPGPSPSGDPGHGGISWEFSPAEADVWERPALTPRPQRKEPKEAGQGTVAVRTNCPLPGEAGAQGPCGTWSQQVAPSEIPKATSSEKGHEAPKREAGYGGASS